MSETIKNRKVEKTEVSQTIDLKKLLGGASKNDAVVQAFIQDVADRIVSRTQDEHKDVNGKIFKKGYSESYENSLEFGVFKTKGQKIDLTLTGSMLSDINITKKSGDKITIGFLQDINNIKAYAHITGFDGHKFIKGIPERDFFGVTDSELSKIAKDYRLDNSQEISKNDNKILSKLLAAVKFGQ